MPSKPVRYRIVPRVVITAARKDPSKPRESWGWIKFRAGDVLPRDVPKRAREAGVDVTTLSAEVIASLVENDAVEVL